MLCRPSGRVSFADALVWAAARSQTDASVYSLDERFPDEGSRAVMRSVLRGSLELGYEVDRACERNGRTGSKTRLIDRSAGPSRDPGIDRRISSGVGQLRVPCRGGNKGHYQAGGASPCASRICRSNSSLMNDTVRNSIRPFRSALHYLGGQIPSLLRLRAMTRWNPSEHR